MTKTQSATETIERILDILGDTGLSNASKCQDIYLEFVGHEVQGVSDTTLITEK